MKNLILILLLASFAVAQNQTATAPLTIVVNPKLAIVVPPTTALQAIVGRAYSLQLTSTGGVGIVTWTITVGALPNGLSMTAGGLISGTPVAVGASNFTITATDQAGSATSIKIKIMDKISVNAELNCCMTERFASPSIKVIASVTGRRN